MPRYEHADISFEVPRDWDDRSVGAFAAQPAPGQTTAPNVVCTRDRLQPGENLAAYADRNLVELAQRLEKFSLQKRSDITVSELPAIEFRFTWRGAKGLVDQRLVMCATGKTAGSQHYVDGATGCRCRYGRDYDACSKHGEDTWGTWRRSSKLSLIWV